MSEMQILDTGGAADQIADLLDDDGQTPDHGAPTRQQEESPRDQLTDEGTDDLDIEASDTDEVEEVEDEVAEPEEVEGETETEQLSSLQELADVLEMDLDEVLSNMTHTFKAAGEEVTASLADLVKSHQQDSDYRKKTTQLAEAKRGFEAEAQRRTEEYQTTSHSLAQQIQFVEQALLGEINSAQLAQLRDARPEEWTARRQELNERLNMVQGVRQKAAQEYSDYIARARQDFMASQGEILSQEVEGWGEEKLGIALDTMRELGFDDDEIVGFGDARFIKAALEFQELRQKVAQLEGQITRGGAAAKKVKQNIPRAIKGAKAKLQTGKSKRTQNLKRALKESTKTGGRANMNAAAAMIENLL